MKRPHALCVAISLLACHPSEVAFKDRPSLHSPLGSPAAMVKRIWAGGDVPSSASETAFRSNFVAFGQQVCFAALAAGNGQELFCGTASGMHLVVDLLPGEDGSRPQSIGVLGDKLVFVAEMPGLGGE